MTRLQTFVKGTDEVLVGVKYCEVIVHDSIPWGMYMQWANEWWEYMYGSSYIWNEADFVFYEHADLASPAPGPGYDLGLYWD